MTEQEMIAVLEEIILDPKAPGSARVTAIRTLHEWRRAAEAEERPSPFDPLYPAFHWRVRAIQRSTSERRHAAPRARRSSGLGKPSFWNTIMPAVFLDL
jgi:hypothetical protein